MFLKDQKYCNNNPVLQNVILFLQQTIENAREVIYI